MFLEKDDLRYIKGLPVRRKQFCKIQKILILTLSLKNTLLAPIKKAAGLG